MSPLNIMNYNSKNTHYNNNIYSNNKGKLAYDYNENYNNLKSLKNYNHRNNLSFGYGKKSFYDNNNNMLNNTSNILNFYTNQLYNNIPFKQNLSNSNITNENIIKILKTIIQIIIPIKLKNII